MRMAQTDDCLTPEEEARMELEYHLNAARWPIDDEEYIEALDEAFAEHMEQAK